MSNDHYFSASPRTPSRRGRVHAAYRGHDLELDTDRGVFATHELDRGTEILLDVVEPPPEDSTLVDVGCGYGPLAIAAALATPSAAVWAVDTNERALELTRDNAARHGCERLRTATPDEVPTSLAIDTIWSNPPIRIGKPALHELLNRWIGQLLPDGRAWLVVNKHLGSDSLHRWLDDQGHSTERVTSRDGYRILRVAPRG